MSAVDGDRGICVKCSIFDSATCGSMGRTRGAAAASDEVVMRSILGAPLTPQPKTDPRLTDIYPAAWADASPDQALRPTGVCAPMSPLPAARRSASADACSPEAEPAEEGLASRSQANKDASGASHHTSIGLGLTVPPTPVNLPHTREPSTDQALHKTTPPLANAMSRAGSHSTQASLDCPLSGTPMPELRIVPPMPVSRSASRSTDVSSGQLSRPVSGVAMQSGGAGSDRSDQSFPPTTAALTTPPRQYRNVVSSEGQSRQPSREVAGNCSTVPSQRQHDKENSPVVDTRMRPASDKGAEVSNAAPYIDKGARATPEPTQMREHRQSRPSIGTPSPAIRECTTESNKPSSCSKVGKPVARRAAPAPPPAAPSPFQD